MIEDVLWKLFRKSLSNGLYDKLKFSKFGRAHDYYSIATYKEIFNQYNSQSVPFEKKVILELGCGFQFYTALHFLQAGALKVILVDPVFSKNDYDRMLEKHTTDYVNEFKLTTPLDTQKIEVYSSLDLIPDKFAGSVDFICSHFVLEHFRNLSSYFRESKRLLSTNGYCYSMVDLSDHTYHIFDSKMITKFLYRNRMIYHLRYSDSFYRLINDDRTWVNRLLFPAYAKLAADSGFKVEAKNLSKCKKTKIHKDVLQKLPYIDDDELYISHFSILLKKY